MKLKKLKTCPVLLIMLASGVASADEVQGRLEPQSYLEYEASTPNEVWRGRAPFERFSLAFDRQNLPETLTLQVELEPSAFNSGNVIRDINGQRTVFETGSYPTISFTSSSVEVSDPTFRSGSQSVTVTGTLTMHGVEKTVSVPAAVTRTGDSFTATGTFEVLLSDYEMRRPSFLFVTVDDEVQIDFTVVGELIPK